MIVLWASALIAFAGIRRLRGQPIFEGFGMPRRGGDDNKPYVLHDKPVRSRIPKPKSPGEKEESENVDAILDKISKRGIGSLTRRERASLERASRNLSAKDRRH
jgi:hypothetical protein